ncbi:MAG: hypothetical protein JNM21_14295 [Taibaiella sp.]|nr:hypothetical protein [Taibaiella sp.]
MNHWAKYIFLLFIWGLALMQGPARAYAGSSAGHVPQISENCLPKVNSDQSDCSSKQLCLPSRHDLDGDNCCRHNSIPVFGLPASLTAQVHPALLVTEQPVFGHAPAYYSSGYQFIWLPPKIDWKADIRP